MSRVRLSSRRSDTHCRRPLFDALEARELLAVRIGVLGDSLSDEYQFYAPDRTAARNWVEQLAALRPNQVDFGAFTADPNSPQVHETRNQGFAQNWARSGAVAFLPATPTFYDPKYQLSNELNGGYPAGSGNVGLLNQPGGLSNVDAVVVLIGGNDFKNEILASLSDPISLIFGRLNSAITRIHTGVAQAVTQIRAADATIPIVIMSTPDPGSTALFGNFIRANLPPDQAKFALDLVRSAVDQADSQLQAVAEANNAQFFDVNDLIDQFTANPTIDGVYIDPFQGGPEFTNLFVGDGFHPGTIGQSLLANAVIGELNKFLPSDQDITPLTNQEVLAFAASVQPDTTATLEATSTQIAPGQSVTFTMQVPVFPTFPTVTEATDQQGFFPTPTGLVQFFDASNDNAPLGFATLRPINVNPTTGVGQLGVATFNTSALGPGVHKITAAYSGDSVYPAAVLPSVTVLVGTPKQIRMFSILLTVQERVAQQITPPQLDFWTRRLNRGQSARRVALAIIRRAQHGRPLAPPLARFATTRFAPKR